MDRVIRTDEARQERGSRRAPRSRAAAARRSLGSSLLAVVAIIAGSGRVAFGSGLQWNPDLDLVAPGLRVSVGGIGLDPPIVPLLDERATSFDASRDAGPDLAGGPPPEDGDAARAGTISIDIDGPVVRATLYWSGVGRPVGGQELRFDGQVFPGVLIGVDATESAVGYLADVTTVVQAAWATHGSGPFDFDVEDPSPIDNLDRMHGAGLIVAYRDESDDTLCRLIVFDGIDSAAERATRREVRHTRPVRFAFEADDRDRTADLVVLCGGADPHRPDLVLVSDNASIDDELNSSNGPAWDSDVFPVFVPAQTDDTIVEIRLPPGSLFDELDWQVAALCLPVAQPCVATIGDFLWRDENRNGCQDPGEPGLGHVRLSLLRRVEGGEWTFAAETVSADDGTYEFGGLCAGAYRIEIDPTSIPTGHAETPANACEDDAKDSDPSDGVVTVTIAENDTRDESIDGGFAPPLPERAHPGWNWMDNEISLTANEPAYWSARTGLPKGVSPWTVLDPGDLPGRPDPDGTTDRVLRGFLVLWVVEPETGREIRWNHLAGDATIVDYRDASAWQYNAFAFQSVADVAHGEPTGTPGILFMNGTEFETGFGELLLNFPASGSLMVGEGGSAVTDTDLTVLPAALDVRPEGVGPRTTMLDFSIWNENEYKFTGLRRCITCWDEVLLSRYDAPNHFLRDHLQTDRGKARINGVESSSCPDSIALSVLGVASTRLEFEGSDGVAVHGVPLKGMGREGVAITYDVHEPPPERPELGDRVDATAKGTILYFAKIEIRWDEHGELVQDTFVHLTNDYPAPLRVKLFFVNGDPPLPGGSDE